MAALRLTVLAVAVVVGVANAGPRPTMKKWAANKAAEKAKAADKAADEKKRGAVDKVIQMLETLSTKVIAEGVAEAKTYNKFACFCQEGQKAKNKAIKEEKDTKASLRADINKLGAGRKKDSKNIKGLDKGIRNTNKDMTKEIKENAAAMKKHSTEKADLTAAISGIESAMKTLKASRPSLLQLKSVSDTVAKYMAMADALGQGVDTAFFQAAPEVQMENYKFHSEGVVGVLEKLLATFREKKAKSDSSEVKRLSDHDKMMQNNKKKVKAKTLELGSTQKEKSDKTAEIAENSQALTTENAALFDDQQYLDGLLKLCAAKAKTWEERSKVRTDEISAITAAVAIVKGAVREKTSSRSIRFAQQGVSIRLAEAVARDEDAMDAVEAAAEEKEASSGQAFLQRRTVSRHLPDEDRSQAVHEISQLLRTVGGKTKSAALSNLAMEISTGDVAPRGMEKIKALVTELIKRLQGEASKEATQKGWCDKSTGAANTKKNSLSEAVDDLNDSVAKLEADRKSLKINLSKLADEIEALKDDQNKSDKMRKIEKRENAETVTEAKEGQAAVNQAIGILEKFYKGAAKKKDKEFKTTKKVAYNSGDAGFSAGEAYKGSQSSAVGVLGMLDVIQSDFVRTIKETDKAENEGQQEYKAFTVRTQTSLTEKEVIERARKKEKNDAESKMESQKETLEKKTELLSNTDKELMQLKKACIDTGMSYAERESRREEEVAALEKGLSILSKLSK